jgi:glycosyltransferase involved in cell wall biosynthesis
MKLSIVLPCYNEADNLPILVEGYRAVWEDLPAELILVDNGSTDHTKDVLASVVNAPFVRSVRVPVNRGYGHGIHTGLTAATGEVVGFSHADMQCPPGDLFRAYHALIARPDPKTAIIKGKRAARPWQDEMVTGGMGLIASTVLGLPLSDINAQPKVFTRDLRDRLTSPPDGFEYDLYVLHTALTSGCALETIPVTFGERAHGESKWKFSLFSRWRTILRVMRYIFALRRGGA